MVCSVINLPIFTIGNTKRRFKINVGVMTKYLSQKELVKAIETNLNNLEAGQLTLAEIEDHLKLVRELYERTLVLRYKAFERQSTVEVLLPQAEEVAPIVEAQEIHEEIVSEPEDTHFEKQEEPVTTEEHPEIEFDFFSSSEEAIIEPEAPLFIPEPQEEINTSEQQEDQTEEEESITEQVSTVKPSEPYHASSDSHTASLYEKRISEIEQEIRNQIGFSPLSTLTGSFGLNERLLYINELFDGSSESFSDAVKHLDSRLNLSETTTYIEEIAIKFNWDIESETVEEFIQKLCRRYA